MVRLRKHSNDSLRLSFLVYSEKLYTFIFCWTVDQMHRPKHFLKKSISITCANNKAVSLSLLKIETAKTKSMLLKI